MGDKDLLDHVFDFMENTTKWLYEKDLIKNWFNFIGWTFMTAVAYGFAKSSDSKVIFCMAAVSVVLVFFHGWHTTHEVVTTFLQERDRLSGKLIVTSLVIATFVPIMLIFYVFSAVLAYLSKIS